MHAEDYTFSAVTRDLLKCAVSEDLAPHVTDPECGKLLGGPFCASQGTLHTPLLPHVMPFEMRFEMRKTGHLPA